MRKRKKTLVFGIILLVMALGIGYAYLTTTLSINGVTDVDRNVWDIYFDNAQVTTGSVTGEQVIEAPTITSDTEVEFHVRLKEPGEFYEFTIDAKNDGTIDAMINSLSKKLNNVEVTTLPAYLRYDITYSDGIPIAENHLLAAESLETYKIRVEYRNDINPSDLPSTAQSLTLSFAVEYVQADENAIRAPHPTSFATDSWETIILAVQTGNTSAYNVGDTKSITLGNDLGTHTLRIANMSTPAECSNPGFSQTACGFVLEFADIINKHVINPTGTYQGTQYTYGWNVDGWPASSMRTYLNDTSSTASIINSLPEELKNAIINTTVISGHGSKTGETNFISTDKLYLLSTHEIWKDSDGNTNTGIDYYDTAYNNTRQLDYYENNNTTTTHYSPAAKKLDGINTVWWLRTAYLTTIDQNRRVDESGYTSYNYVCNPAGVSPAFRLG